jgi:hypothetical protein
MKFTLELFEIGIDSIDSLKLYERQRLLKLWYQVKELTTVAEVKFFGTGDKLKPISMDQLLKVFGKRKAQIHRFADVKNVRTENPRCRWAFIIRQDYVGADLYYESSPEKYNTLTSELVTLNEILLTSIEGGKVRIPFSSLGAPDVHFKVTRPPRFFRRISPDSLVDLIYLESVYMSDDQQIIERLKNDELIEGAERVFKGNLLLIKWGDIRQQPAETILAKRYSWLAEHLDLPIDESFNSIGDKEFALWEAEQTKQLTAYSSFSKKGAKAVVFDEVDEELESLIKGLHKILVSGKTVEGYPIEEITLITPSRESAVKLRPLANKYQMRVVYVGTDDRLWDPFPPEYDDNPM